MERNRLEKRKGRYNIVQPLGTADVVMQQDQSIFREEEPTQKASPIIAKSKLRFRLIIFALFIPIAVFLSLHDFGPVAFLLFIILVVFLSLGTRSKDELSPYAVFNPGQERMAGDLSMVDIENSIRRGNLSCCLSKFDFPKDIEVLNEDDDNE